MPDVSILICVHGKLELTRRCLETRSPRPRPPGATRWWSSTTPRPTGAATRSRRSPRGYPAPLKVVRSAENLGFVGGNNLAAAARDAATYLVLLNNDTEPQPGWLEALLEIAERDPAVGAVGAKLVYPDGRLQEAGGIVFADASGWNYGRGGDPDDPRFALRARGRLLLGRLPARPRARSGDELGGFDERYAPAYYEDTDLCFAVRERGLPGRLPAAPPWSSTTRAPPPAPTPPSGFKQHQVVEPRRASARSGRPALRAQQPPHPALVRRASHRVDGQADPRRRPADADVRPRLRLAAPARAAAACSRPPATR